MSEKMSAGERSAADAVMDGGGLSGSHIPMDESEANSWLEKIYGLTGEITRLPAEKDDTFRVTIQGRAHSVLKVANPHDPCEELDFQIQLMKHVAHADPAIPIPAVFTSVAGQHLTHIIDAANQSRQVWMIEHLPGTTLDSFDIDTKQREQVGAVLGKLRNATANYHHPRDSRILAWDVKHLNRLAPLLGFIDNQEHQELVRQGLERFAQLQPQVDQLRTQVLHNDFSKSNILGDPTKSDFVTGIIDFGDAVRTAIAVDVATALLHNLPRNIAENPDQDVLAGSRDIVRGYLSTAELNAQEIALIPHLTMGRVVARALITIRRAQLFPYNITYILRNTEPGWAQLQWFMNRSIQEISSDFENGI